jgi:tetratricopeptide (TPR) repeat protein
MNKFLVFIFVLAAVLSARAETFSPGDAQALFDKGEFVAGVNLILKNINSPDPAVKASALLTYGQFYQDMVGSNEEALRYFSQVIKTPLIFTHPLKTAAQDRIAIIKLLKTQFASQDRFLDNVRVPEQMDKNQIIAQAASLEKFLIDNPDYYRNAEIYYNLGRDYFALDKFHLAAAKFSQAIAIKPAIDLILPAGKYARQARQRWLRYAVKTVADSLITALAIIALAAFLLARPWRFVKFRHLLAGLGIAILWTLVFAAAFKLLTVNAAYFAQRAAKLGISAPIFVRSGPGGPYWNIITALFTSGLIGLAIVYVFAIGLGRIKRRWAAMLLSLIFSLAVFCSLATMFYMRYCDQKSTFDSPRAGEVSSYLGFGNYFLTTGIEPYILIDPTAYPGLSIDYVPDTYLLNWIKSHCKFTADGPKKDND